MNQARLVAGRILKTNAYPRPNPSLIHFPGLTSKPIWNNTKQFPFVKLLQQNYTEIRDQFFWADTNSLDDYQKKNNEHTLHTGNWKWINYIQKGQIQPKFQSIFPKLKQLLEMPQFKDCLLFDVPMSYAFFSIMEPTTHIKPHFGPCNFRLRCHFPIQIPQQSFIKVAGESLSWKEGQVLIFDDSYQHQAANLNSQKKRILFLFDIWHPDITSQQKIAILDLFKDVERIQKSRGIKK